MKGMKFAMLRKTSMDPVSEAQQRSVEAI